MSLSFTKSYKTSEQAQAAAQPASQHALKAPPAAPPPKLSGVQEAIAETRKAFQTAEENAGKPKQKDISTSKKSFEGMIEENKDGEISDAEFLSSLENIRRQLASYLGGRRRKTRRRKTHRRR
jgi:hypothetical protein